MSNRVASPKPVYRETKKLEFMLSAQTFYSSFQVILDILLWSGLTLLQNFFFLFFGINREIHKPAICPMQVREENDKTSLTAAVLRGQATYKTSTKLIKTFSRRHRLTSLDGNLTCLVT